MSRELKFPESEEDRRKLVPNHMMIPTGWLISVVFGLLINGGILFQQFTTMKEGNIRSDIMIALIRENQIKGLAEVANLKVDVQNHENRIVVIEKYVLTKEAK